MTPTHVELYEALKPSIGENAARMIAEVVPAAGDLATKRDLEAGFAALSRTIDSGFARVDVEFGRVWEEFAKMRGEMHAETTRTIKWFIGVFVPVLALTWGTILTAVLKS